MVRSSKYDKILLLIFLFTLPLTNPWVRGDGVGYYAFARSLLIEHDLDFKKDWLAANPNFRMGRVDANGTIVSGQYTSTGHLDNHFSIGPAILWSPFLVTAHLAVLSYDALGGHVAADGYSRALHFGHGAGNDVLRVSRYLDFIPARSKVSSRTMGLLGGSGYLVCEFPARVHVFQPVMVPRSLRIHRCSLRLVLGSHACYAHISAMGASRADRRTHDGCLLSERDPAFVSVAGIAWPSLERLRATHSRIRSVVYFWSNVIFAGAALVAFLPTLITKKIIYGSYLNFGYTEHLVLEFASFAQGMFFGGARSDQLDSHRGLRGCRNDFASAA